jgi:hypothetical protein
VRRLGARDEQNHDAPRAIQLSGDAAARAARGDPQAEPPGVEVDERLGGAQGRRARGSGGRRDGSGPPGGR